MNKYLFTFFVFSLIFSTSKSQCVSGDCEMGFGIMKYENGVVYIGEWWNGEMNGEGTMIWSDGSVYTGNFKHGLYHGSGTYLSMSETEDLTLYVGDFFEEVPDGFGTKIFKNGNVYVGDFKEGRMSGFGILKYGFSNPELKNVIKEGQWHNDKSLGQVLFKKNGYIFKGN